MPSLQYRAIIVSIQVINPLTGATAGGSARVDSGADISLVDSSVVNQLGLSPVSSTQVQGINGNPVNVYEYNVSINLGQFGYIPQLRIAAIDGLVNRDGYQCLLGTDAISTGIVDIDGLTQQFTLQLGISQPVSTVPLPPWIVPAAIGAAALGLAAVVWLMSR